MKRPTLFHRVTYCVARAGIFMVALLPERLAYGALGMVGALYVTCSPRRRAIGEANLALALPASTAAERRRILRRSTANSFQNVLDMIWSLRLLAKGRLLERVDVNGFQQKVSTPPPWIGCAAHLGSWEVAASSLAAIGYECHALGRMPKNPLTAAFLRRSRESAGFVLHPRRGGIRPLARALAGGKVGLQVIDQNQRLRGVFVPLFGRLASTERSAATLALRRGYPVYVGVAVRLEKRFRFRLEVLGPLHPALRDGEPMEDGIRRICTDLNRALEELIVRHADQYLWIHDRYRTRPPEEMVGADSGGPRA